MAAVHIMFMAVFMALSVVRVSGQVFPCNLTTEAGICKARITRYAYINGRCAQFIYGGCQGNENNFESKEECEKSCPPSINTTPPPAKKETCKQPLETGQCRALFTRWGSEDGTCREFVYGGCGGNGNNFQSKEECEKSCPPSINTTPPPVKEETCKQPLETGQCRALFTRWGSEDGTCREFVYGGCGGNNNNFQSKEECEKLCPPSISTTPRPLKVDICDQPLVTGRCRASFQRWGSENGTCRMFTYGGCGGNNNRFSSKKSCEEACIPIQKCGPISPPKTKKCTKQNKLKTVFVFNPKTNQCKEKSSCKVHEKQAFSSEEECERVCMPEEKAVKCGPIISPQAKNCKKSDKLQSVFVFNPKTNQCKEKSACKVDEGQAFRTKKQCQKKCVRKSTKKE